MFYAAGLRHSGWYPIWNLRLFRHTARVDTKIGRLNEHLVLNGKDWQSASTI